MTAQMHALFIHGMGRSTLSGWPLLRRLRPVLHSASSFSYSAASENFPAITARLAERISAIAERTDYALIGHSLGGVLLRAALHGLPAEVAMPRHVFMLGSPMRPAQLAQQWGRNPLYRAITGDCGMLLGSSERMAAIGALALPTTTIAGVRGLPLRRNAFGGEPNDGVVALSEVSADWAEAQWRVPVIHTLLPASEQVAAIILRRIAALPA
jgi:pimeloyl-ACP methyl ester carboxylesterase